jgi:hypothetical protein
MGRLVAVLATLACMIGLTVAPAPPAAADAPTVGAPGWSVSLTFPDLQWSSEACQYLPVTAVVTGTGIESWTFGGFVTKRQGEDDGEGGGGWYIDYDTKISQGVGTFDFRHAVVLCPDSDSTGAYDVVGEVGVRVAGATGWTWVPYRAAFTVSGIPTTTSLDAISAAGPEVVFAGKVVAAPAATASFRRCGGWLTVEGSAGGEWEEVGGTDVGQDGSFAAMVPTYRLTEGQYRARFYGSSICAGSTSADQALPIRLPKVSVNAVAKQSKFVVDIDPNMGRKSWVLQLQRRGDDDVWRDLGTYRTQGKRETRTINPRKGVYRVHVLPRFGYAETFSDYIYLER